MSHRKIWREFFPRDIWNEIFSWANNIEDMTYLWCKGRLVCYTFKIDIEAMIGSKSLKELELQFNDDEQTLTFRYRGHDQITGEAKYECGTNLTKEEAAFLDWMEILSKSPNGVRELDYLVDIGGQKNDLDLPGVICNAQHREISFNWIRMLSRFFWEQNALYSAISTWVVSFLHLATWIRPNDVNSMLRREVYSEKLSRTQKRTCHRLY